MIEIQPFWVSIAIFVLTYLLIIAERINRSGAAYVTPALLDGRWMVRVSIGSLLTEREHVAALWDVMRREAERTA